MLSVFSPKKNNALITREAGIRLNRYLMLSFPGVDANMLKLKKAVYCIHGLF